MTSARIQRILRLVEEETTEAKAHAEAEISASKARADQDIAELKARADDQITALRAQASHEATSLGQVIDVMVAQKRDLAATRDSSPAPFITGRPRLRSPLIARPPTRGCSMSWRLPPAMTPSNTETTRSKPITDG